MKTVWRVLLIAAAAGSGLRAGPAAAQSTQPEAKAAGPAKKVDQQMLQQALTEGRRKLFSAGMNLSPKEFETFWGIYGDFEKEKEALDASRGAILKTVAERYGKATGSEAMAVVNESAQLQQKEIALRKKYADLLGQRVSPSAGVRFWQIDDYITTALRLDVLDDIPLFREAAPTPQ
jgi:hypothetical protein